MSGIGAAHHLQTLHPARSYAVLEARQALGGTWDLFRYPGIRSDSDLHTFGYEFMPWRGEKAIADGDAIRAYLHDTAARTGIDRKLRMNHKVVSAAWSTTEARWRVEVERTDTGERFSMTCGWLFCASGYYRYDEGYTPRSEGRDRFCGRVVHPQHWPEGLDCAGKQVVVIGSGATAVTLVPALARTAAQVTMLQRTPACIMAAPSRDRLDNVLRRTVGERRAFALTRRKNIALGRAVVAFCQRFPGPARRMLVRSVARELPRGYPVDEHFNPPYDPWDQRLCVAPDGDLFKAVREGTASVVTDHVDTFTETGIRLRSGRELPADVIVTATGLNLLAFGGITLSVDGDPVHLPDTVSYRGLMVSGVPNFAYAIGYLTSSWTLKVGLLCEYFGRVLKHMDRHGYSVCLPEPAAAGAATAPLFDFAAGYLRRSVDQFPRRGESAPWVTASGYHWDIRLLRRSRTPFTGLRFVTGRPDTRQAPLSAVNR